MFGLTYERLELQESPQFRQKLYSLYKIIVSP